MKDLGHSVLSCVLAGPYTEQYDNAAVAEQNIFYGWYFIFSGGVWVFLYRAVHQWMQSLLRETGEPRLESAQGPGLSHH